MSDNKFIKHLRGENTAKSVLEIKNQRTTTSFANMPDGDTSNANDVYSDHRGNAATVLKGTENWKLDRQNLVETTTVYGDGRDFTDSFSVFGNGLWVDATCTFATTRRFSPNTKFVLKLCGHDLETVINHTINFTLIVKFGVSTLISKTFTVTEQAFDFCKEFVIDFAESNSSTIMVDAGSTMQIQLLCADPDAQAVLYNGMTVFTALQRRVDGDAVASDKKTFDEVVDQIDQIQEDLDDLEEYVDDTFVKKVGDTMSGTLNIIDPNGTGTNTVLKLGNGSTASRYWNLAPSASTQSMSVYPGTSESNGYRFVSTGFCPASNNARYLGASSLKWRAVYTSEINNGSSIAVPNKSGTMALMSDVELAANSGTQLYTTGVWYAKMYQGSTIPAWAEVEGRLLADFSQTEKERPIIVIYEYHNGQWEQIDSFFPPEQYNGYITVTSKILDIQEQSGQQGGKVLWSFNKQTFTPYPLIVSFEDIQVTGNSTVIMPYNPSADQIVNKNYVDTLVSNSIGDATITLTQGGQTIGSFTTNQSSDATIDINSGGAGHNVGDVFFTMRNDNELNGAVECNGATYNTTDFTGAQSIGQLLEDGKVPYLSLADYATALTINGSVGVFGWDGTNTTAFRVPSLNDIFTETGTASQIGDYLSAGAPNITGTFGVGPYTETPSASLRSTYATGAFTAGPSANAPNNVQGAANYGTHPRGTEFNASRSSSIYGNSNTIQPNTVRYRAMVQLAVSATDEAVETCTSVLADVADLKDHRVIAFQAPTAANNYTWYRLYADGWVEQGGIINPPTGDTTQTVTFPVPFADTNYTLFGSIKNAATTATMWDGHQGSSWATKTTTSFTRLTYGTEYNWRAEGMAA